MKNILLAIVVLFSCVGMVVAQDTTPAPAPLPVQSAAPGACSPVQTYSDACTPAQTYQAVPKVTYQALPTVTYQAAPVTTYQAAPVAVYQDAPIYGGTFFDDGSGNLVPMDDAAGGPTAKRGATRAFGNGSWLAARQNARAAFHASRATTLRSAGNYNMMRSSCPGGNCPNSSMSYWSY